jgi:hypothetical protein
VVRILLLSDTSGHISPLYLPIVRIISQWKFKLFFNGCYDFCLFLFLSHTHKQVLSLYTVVNIRECSYEKESVVTRCCPQWWPWNSTKSERTLSWHWYASRGLSSFDSSVSVISQSWTLRCTMIHPNLTLWCRPSVIVSAKYLHRFRSQKYIIWCQSAAQKKLLQEKQCSLKILCDYRFNP